MRLAYLLFSALWFSAVLKQDELGSTDTLHFAVVLMFALHFLMGYFLGKKEGAR